MKRILTTVPDGPDSTAMIDLSEIIMFSADNAEGRQRTVIRFAGAASTPFWLEIPFEEFKELMTDPERVCQPFQAATVEPDLRHSRILAVLDDRLRGSIPENNRYILAGEILAAIESTSSSEPSTKPLATPKDPQTCMYLMPPDHKTHCSNLREPGWVLCAEHRVR